MTGATRKNASGELATDPPAVAAELAAARFREASAEIRGCAIIGPSGLLTASGEDARWESAARELLDAANAAAGMPASHAHVATEEGEVYAVRDRDLAIVAVTERFTLASLVLADMRAALRNLRAADTGAASVAQPRAA